MVVKADSSTEFRDLHAHYLAPSVVSRIAQGEFGTHITSTEASGSTRFHFPTDTSRVLMPSMVDIEDRIRHLDACSIDVQVLSTWIDMFGYDLPEDVAVAYHTSINEGMATAVALHPDRLQFFASVPLPWGDAAAAVLKDAVNRLGAVGSMIGTNVGGSYLDDVRLEPFWKESEQLDVPVELHPVNVAGSDRLENYGFSNFLGNPFDTTIAASSLIFGGVLDRYPKLRVVLVHGGGYLAYASGRLTHGRRARQVVPGIQMDPVDYLKRFYFDTVVYDDKVLEALATVVGTEHLVLGTDYPFDMEPPNVWAMVERVLGSQSMAVIAENARGLCGLIR